MDKGLATEVLHSPGHLHTELDQHLSCLRWRQLSRPGGGSVYKKVLIVTHHFYLPYVGHTSLLFALRGFVLEKVSPQVSMADQLQYYHDLHTQVGSHTAKGYARHTHT